MTPRLCALAFAPALLLTGACGDDSTSQVPPRPPAPVVAPSAAPPPAAATPTAVAEATVGTAIGAPLALDALANAMLALKLPAERTGVFATTTDGTTFQLVVPPNADAAFATALARSLGSVSTTAVSWPPATAPIAIGVYAVRGGTALHAQAATRGETVAMLPDGAFFVGLRGSIPGTPAAITSDETWTYGVDPRGFRGFVQGTAIAPEEGCILARDHLASTLGMRLDDPALDTMLVGNMHVHRDGQSHRGSFAIGPGFVALLRRPANCAHAELDLRIDVDATVEEFHHALDRESGNTFVAIATEPQNGADESEWSFYPPRATEPALSLSLPTNATVPANRKARVRFALRRGPANARGYWAFSVQAHGEDAVYYTSDGATFAEFTTATPATPEPIATP